ncbi:hypothetical protein [Endozoicomonas sp. 8E]|uniref:hypothetical protein n=1 Tax=Endozoicomonas sp. 8E TaxID=3035692 RepID=UPI002939222D|nr:hypothetical protein [Endozoicomonas sp. 8E]WOG27082.1 hypothetical protein P6910_21405 [Endozoicomonas sp. 8E]
MNQNQLHLSRTAAIQINNDSSQTLCNLIEVGQDGLQRQRRKICNNIQDLSNHKSRYHTGERICDMIVVGADGQQRPCRKVCKNAASLSVQKRTHRKHKPFDVGQDVRQ